MSLKYISTAIDNDLIMKGDVVIVKRTYVDPRMPKDKQLQTVCSHCGQLFPTSYRRMGSINTDRGCEVRNVPQCGPCRSRYRKEKRAAARVAAVVETAPFKVGDRVRVKDAGFLAAFGIRTGDVVTIERVGPGNLNPERLFAFISGASEAACDFDRFELVEHVPTSPAPGPRMVTCSLALSIPHLQSEACINPKEVA